MGCLWQQIDAQPSRADGVRFLHNKLAPRVESRDGTGRRKAEKQGHEPENSAVDYAGPRAELLLAAAQSDATAKLDAGHQQADDEQSGKDENRHGGQYMKSSPVVIHRAVARLMTTGKCWEAVTLRSLAMLGAKFPSDVDYSDLEAAP